MRARSSYAFSCTFLYLLPENDILGVLRPFVFNREFCFSRKVDVAHRIRLEDALAPRHCIVSTLESIFRKRHSIQSGISRRNSLSVVLQHLTWVTVAHIEVKWTCLHATSRRIHLAHFRMPVRFAPTSSHPRTLFFLRTFGRAVLAALWLDA